jgi:putative DNA primase/helicase
MNLAQVASQMRAVGLSVCPAYPPTHQRSKAPAIDSWTQWQTTLPPVEAVNSWDWRDRLIGVFCGPVSKGLEVLDFDIPDKHDEGFVPKSVEPPLWQPWKQAVLDHDGKDLLARLVIVRTPSGGFHCYYRCKVNRQKSAKDDSKKLAHVPVIKDGKETFKDCIEIQSEGFFAVCYPSEGYELVQGTLDHIPVITPEERELLITVARMMDRKPPECPPEPRRNPSAEQGTRPGDIFNARGEWADVLDGWQILSRTWRGQLQLVRRPGKSKSWSGGFDDDHLIVWTDQTALEPGRSYSKFSAYAILHHGGDFTAATKALAAKGFCVPRSGQPAPAEPQVQQEPSADIIRQIQTIKQDDLKHLALLHDHALGAEWEARARETLRLCHEQDSWYELDASGVWSRRPGRDTPAVHHAGELASAISDSAEDFADSMNLADDDKEGQAKQTAWKKAAKKIASRNAIQNMVALGRTFPTIHVRPEQFDADPYLIGTESGILDLRTGALVPDGPARLVTRAVPYAYEPDAKCPIFERFLSDIYEERGSVVKLVTCGLAYSLSGLTTEQFIVLMYGERGRNGKSKVFEAMRSVLGTQYFRAIDKRLLLERSSDSARFSLAQLEGVRMATASETSGTSQLDTEFLKALTGEKELFAEQKGKDGYAFQPQAKLWFATNHLPYARFDSSFRSRLLPVPHTRSYYAEDDPSYRTGDSPPDKLLGDKLEAERQGIFSYLVRTFRDVYMKEGIVRPKEVLDLAGEYEKANDHVALFLSECVERGEHDTHRVQASELFKAYSDFCKRMRLPQPGRYNEFCQRVREEPAIGYVKPGNKSTFTGISLEAHDSQPWWNKDD